MNKAYVIYYKDIPNNKIVALGTIHPNLKDAQKAMRISMSRIRTKYAKNHAMYRNDIEIFDFARSAVLIMIDREHGYKKLPKILYKYRIEELLLY